MRAGALRMPLAVALVAASIGCGHTETHQALFRAPEPETRHTVEIYMADQPIPARAYYEIALVQAVGFGSEAHPEDIAVALTEKAGKLGCDAVVRVFLDQGYSRANASGVCVKWVGAPVPGASPASPASPAQTSLTPSPGVEQPPSKIIPHPAPRMEQLPSAGPGGAGIR